MKKFIIACFVFAGAAQAAEVGPLPPAPMPEPGAAGPIQHSRMFVGETSVANGRAVLDLPVDAAGNAYLVVFNDQPLTARAPQSDGTARELPNRAFRNPVLESMNVPAVGARIELDALGRGKHRVNLDTVQKSGALRYAVVLPESAMDMRVQLAPLAATAGETITVTASLSDVVTAEIDAKIRGAGRIALQDDGSGADTEAGDGIYTGTFIAPRGKGLEETVVRVDARGQLADGLPFRRTASAVAMVSHGAVELGGIKTYPDALRIPMDARSGHYRIEAIFGANGQTLAFAREIWQGGKPFVDLARPEAAAAADRVIVRVLDMQTLALAGEIALDIEPLASGMPHPARAAPAMPASKARAADRFGVDR